MSAVDSFNPVANPVMNSLVSPTQVILNESIPNPIIPMASSNISLPSQLPVSTLPVPILGLKTLEHGNGHSKLTDQSMNDKCEQNESLINESVLEDESFIEHMKKEEKADDADPIIVDELEPVRIDLQQNGIMSLEGKIVLTKVCLCDCANIENH